MSPLYRHAFSPVIPILLALAMLTPAVAFAADIDGASATDSPTGARTLANSVSAESKEAFCRGIERNGMVLHPSTHIALNEYNPIEIMKATLS